MTCEVCGNDPVADARARDRQHEIKHQYRRALYLACGGDKEKVKRMMSRAEDEMCQVPPNMVLRPSSNELGEAIDAAVEMIERLEAAEKEIESWKGLAQQFGNEADALRGELSTEKRWIEDYKKQIVSLQNRLEASEHECTEQARLNGMGSEREAALMAKLEAAERSDAESIAMYRKARDERDALRAKVEQMEAALQIAMRQNSHDMLMTGDELRQCEAALEKAK